MRAVQSLIEDVEVTAKGSAVETSALVPWTAEVGGFQVHDTIAPLQWAGLHRRSQLLLDGIE